MVKIDLYRKFVPNMILFIWWMRFRQGVDPLAKCGLMNFLSLMVLQILWLLARKCSLVASTINQNWAQNNPTEFSIHGLVIQVRKRALMMSNFRGGGMVRFFKTDPVQGLRSRFIKVVVDLLIFVQKIWLGLHFNTFHIWFLKESIFQASEALHMIGYEFFVKSIMSCISKLKVLPSFCFPNAIPN